VADVFEVCVWTLTLGRSVFQAELAMAAELHDADTKRVLGLVEATSTDTFLDAALAKRLSKDHDGFNECLVALRKLRDAVGQLCDFSVEIEQIEQTEQTEQTEQIELMEMMPTRACEWRCVVAGSQLSLYSVAGNDDDPGSEDRADQPRRDRVYRQRSGCCALDGILATKAHALFAQSPVCLLC